MSLDSSEMQDIYEQTIIVRGPTYGIVSGYHELPYVCLGQSLESNRQTTRIKGRVQVSPRFVLRPQHLEPSYGEIFGDDNVDAEIAGRMFGFLGFKGRPVECTSEFLEVIDQTASIDRMVSETLDDLDRNEDITTGVIITPNPQYYPVSVERFISTVLDDEFNA